MLIVDAHLDIADNALKFGRDPLLPLAQIRASEIVDPRRGVATVSFPELREAGVAIIFGTIFVLPTAVSEIMELDPGDSYHDPQTAHRLGMAQFDFYHRLADKEENRIRLIGDSADLEAVLNSHQDGQEPLLGIVPLMEGADPIREPEELELWVERGLRVVGPAWDDTRYAPGAWRSSTQGLPAKGRTLLEIMAEYRLILDLSHMNERSSLEALDLYEGQVAATHSNARALVPGERQLSDNQIRAIGEHDGVIGVVLYNRFLRAGYRKGDPKETVTLDHVVAHIDHICQVLGDARHAGLGSDLDGGFGRADIPVGMDNAIDLPLIAGKLAEYGYNESNIAAIMGGNWVDLLQKAFSG